MADTFSNLDDSQPHNRLLERLAHVKPAGPDRWTATCPAHGSGRNRALSIRLEGERVLLHCFAGCPAEAVLHAVGLSWRELYRGSDRPWLAPRRRAEAPTPEAGVREPWERWWKSAKPDHPLLRAYLRARGLNIEPPPSLRLALWGDRPVVLARVEDVRGELRGLHLTFLEPDGSGRKEKKLAAGSKPLGAAIRLYPLEADKPLALTEGIETALAVRGVTGWPVWACVSAGGLERVVLPPEAHEVVIAADHDRAGLEAARKLAGRLLAEGRRVRLAVPRTPGADWLDVLVANKTPAW